METTERTKIPELLGGEKPTKAEKIDDELTTECEMGVERLEEVKAGIPPDRLRKMEEQKPQYQPKNLTASTTGRLTCSTNYRRHKRGQNQEQKWRRSTEAKKRGQKMKNSTANWSTKAQITQTKCRTEALHKTCLTTSLRSMHNSEHCWLLSSKNTALCH